MSIDELVGSLKMQEVSEHYRKREATHNLIRHHFDGGEVEAFVNLALGITDSAGNYSAAEHMLGPRILLESSHQEVFDLATAIEACPNSHHLPDLIYRHRLPNLKISVGTEMAMMLKPSIHWVGNVRTIWSHLLVKHAGSRSRANQELNLYRDNQRDSEMDYAVWRDIYLALESNIQTLGRIATDVARAQNIEAGRLQFMWPDAVASFMFDRFAN